MCQNCTCTLPIEQNGSNSKRLTAYPKATFALLELFTSFSVLYLSSCQFTYPSVFTSSLILHFSLVLPSFYPLFICELFAFSLYLSCLTFFQSTNLPYSLSLTYFISFYVSLPGGGQDVQRSAWCYLSVSAIAGNTVVFNKYDS